MSLSMTKYMMAALSELQYQPILKRVRVRLGDQVVADTTHPMLIWEPQRVVPSYAVPAADISATLQPAPAQPTPEYRPVGFGKDSPPLLDPGVPFAVHTTDGDSLTVEVPGGRREAAAFRLGDPDLNGYVVLEFQAFDWWEEDEAIVGHPRNPYHRIDVLRSSRRVRVEHKGTVLADSDRGLWLFEGAFPMVRHYLPKQDVRARLLPGTLQTTCAYKGQATHYTVMAGDEELPNIAWSYENPLADATAVKGLICFYEERLDLVVDGERVERVRTPWS